MAFLSKLLRHRVPGVAAALVIASATSIFAAAAAAATYKPGYGSWHDLYYLDGAWLGQDLNQVDYYTWSDGTESVSNVYGGIYRSYQDQGLGPIIWRNPDVLNRNGTAAWYISYGHNDAGYGNTWYQIVWQGWFTVYAQSDYGMLQHLTNAGAGRWQPSQPLWWP